MHGDESSYEWDRRLDVLVAAGCVVTTRHLVDVYGGECGVGVVCVFCGA